MRRRQYLGQADDPAQVVDYSQVRQSFFDPNLNPSPPDDLAAVVTVSAPPLTTPVWPLLIVIGLVGYALFYSGKHYA